MVSHHWRAWCKTFTHAIEYIIATKTITSNNIPFSQAYSNLMQQLSVNLWKFNTRMIESRLLLDSDDCFWDLPIMSVSVLL